MRIRRHVVEACPRILDRGARGRRIPPLEPLEPVGRERRVDYRLERPARLRIGHCEHEPLASAAEVEAALGLDHHRQLVRQAGDGRRLEQLAADLAEEARPERGQEPDALAGEHDLLARRELLPYAAHRTRRRAGHELPTLCDDDVVRAEQCEVVRDARSDGAGACDDYPSHSRTIRSTSVCSSSVRPRSGGRTTARTGTPRRPSAAFDAAWKGIAWSAARNRPTRSPAAGVGSRTSATTASGKLPASPETAPTAPRANPWGISTSGPTKMSSPSSTYGSRRSHGVSDTLRPTKFGACSRSVAI